MQTTSSAPSRKRTQSSDGPAGPRERRTLETQAHGALVEVLEVGVLILGPSGIGKSECALELVTRGHRLVADDVVRIRRTEDGRLIGSAPELIRHYVEIRGLGLLLVPELFGPDAVRDEAELNLVCRLERWREDAEYERLGLDRPTEEILGLPLPTLLLPLRPAGSMATLVEVGARDWLRRRAGSNAARTLDERVRGAGGPP
jgi:HPr kinase/phosphorylase